MRVSRAPQFANSPLHFGPIAHRARVIFDPNRRGDLGLCGTITVSFALHQRLLFSSMFFAIAARAWRRRGIIMTACQTIVLIYFDAVLTECCGDGSCFKRRVEEGSRAPSSEEILSHQVYLLLLQRLGEESKLSLLLLNSSPSSVLTPTCYPAVLRFGGVVRSAASRGGRKTSSEQLNGHDQATCIGIVFIIST